MKPLIFKRYGNMELAENLHLPKFQRVMKVSVSFFVIWHCLTIADGLGLCSLYGDFKELHRIVEPYVFYFGVWQNWKVFAPVPKDYNIYLTAVLDFTDGTQKIWYFPRMEKISVLRRPWKERYRKWYSESLYDQRAWPDTARFIARINSSDKKVPSSVTLVRHWSYIRPRPQGYELDDQGECYESPFYSFQVKEEEL